MVQGGTIAINSKALAGADKRGRAATPLDLVNAFAEEARLALRCAGLLGATKAAAALDMLEMLNLRNCIVTGDTLHCHKSFPETVIARCRVRAGAQVQLEQALQNGGKPFL